MTAALPQPSRDSDWTVETLRQLLVALLADQARLLEEMDRRYQQRFEAQAAAIDAALAAANRAMDQMGTTNDLSEAVVEVRAGTAALTAMIDARFATYRALIEAQAERMAYGLASSDKAVQKAETATERRFESVNEFRAQLTDQAATFIPRAEAEQRIRQNAEKIDALAEVVDKLATRIDVREGRSGGHIDSTKNLVTLIGIGLALISALTVIVSVYLASKR